MSQQLHKKYKYKVLGLEADQKLVNSALIRQNELFPESIDDVKYTKHFIRETSGEIINEHLIEYFPNTDEAALIGLHACADLSITAIKLFFSMQNMKKLIITPCCYHKMKMNKENGFINVPLSKKLSKIYKGHDFINRCFLRLACNQTASRWKDMTVDEHRRHGRDMLEHGVLICIFDDYMKSMRKTLPTKEPQKLTFQYMQDNYLFFDIFKVGSAPLNSKHEKIFDEIWREYPNEQETSQGTEFLTCLQTLMQVRKLYLNL